MQTHQICIQNKGKNIVGSLVVDLDVIYLKENDDEIDLLVSLIDIFQQPSKNITCGL